MPSIRSKKWTWVILLRLIQASITNAIVLKNLVSINKKKVGTKEIALDISRNYLANVSAQSSELHKTAVVAKKRNCSNFSKYSSRTQKICTACNVYVCSTCFLVLAKLIIFSKV